MEHFDSYSQLTQLRNSQNSEIVKAIQQTHLE